MASRLQVTKNDDVFVVRFLEQKLVGDLPTQLGQELYGVASQGDCTKILLSFSGVKFVATDMLGKVMGLSKTMKAKGGKFVLCGICPHIREVLSTTKLDTILTVKATEAEGLMALANGRCEESSEHIPKFCLEAIPYAAGCVRSASQ